MIGNDSILCLLTLLNHLVLVAGWGGPLLWEKTRSCTRQTQLFPAISERDPLLAKAEPLVPLLWQDIYERVINSAEQMWERRVRKMWEKQLLQTRKPMKKQREEVLQASESRDSPALFPFMGKNLLEKVVPWSPWSTMLEQMCTLQSMEDPMPEQVDVYWRKLHLMEIPHRRRLLASTMALWRGAHVGAGFLAGTVVPEGPTLEQFLKYCLWEGAMLNHFMNPLGRTPQGGMGRVWRWTSVRDEVLWTNCNHCSLALLEGIRLRNWKWIWAFPWGVGKVFLVLFLFVSILLCY